MYFNNITLRDRPQELDLNFLDVWETWLASDWPEAPWGSTAEPPEGAKRKATTPQPHYGGSSGAAALVRATTVSELRAECVQPPGCRTDRGPCTAA